MFSFALICLLAACARADQHVVIQKGKFDELAGQDISTFAIPEGADEKTFTEKELWCPYPYPKLTYFDPLALHVSIDVPADVSTSGNFKQITVRSNEKGKGTVAIKKQCALYAPSPFRSSSRGDLESLFNYLQSQIPSAVNDDRFKPSGASAYKPKRFSSEYNHFSNRYPDSYYYPDRNPPVFKPHDGYDSNENYGSHQPHLQLNHEDQSYDSNNAHEHSNSNEEVCTEPTHEHPHSKHSSYNDNHHDLKYLAHHYPNKYNYVQFRLTDIPFFQKPGDSSESTNKKLDN